jgi:hypothetical protein
MSDEFYSGDELEKSAYARVLLTGRRKIGKTVSLLLTAPGPIAMINCDGPGAPQAALRFMTPEQKASLKVCDVTTASGWRKACAGAYAMAERGEVRTIIGDTITLLINKTLAQEMAQKFQGYEIWRNVQSEFYAGFNRLWTAQAHVFIVAHNDMDNGQLTLSGALKEDFPGLMNDIVNISYMPKREHPRMFEIGPSASGLSGGRTSDENKQIPADVRILLAELGLEE